MPVDLTGFVNGALDALGSSRSELAKGSGVYRAAFEQPETAALMARFLGRDQSDILYTFDLARWEEGTKLECLSALSPLVERLGAYACGLGRVAHAHIPCSGEYSPVLAARFSAKFVCDTVKRRSRWLGARIGSEEQVKIRGSALDNPSLVEGIPDGALVDPQASIAALKRLADIWNRDVAKEALKIQSDLETRYKTEADDIVRSRKGDASERALRLLMDRLRLKVDSRLDIAVVVWIPATGNN